MFLQIGGVAYFTASTVATGRELYRTDGTVAGTTLVADIWPGPTGSNPGHLTATAGMLWFTADDGVHGSELWMSDGTTAGTHFVCDIAQGSSSTSFRTIHGFGSRVLVSASDGVHGTELWVSDGTAAGTTLLLDIVPGLGSGRPASFANLPNGNQALFRAQDNVHGYELWITDGTTAGTALLADIRPGSIGSEVIGGAPVPLRAFGSKVLFTANDGVSGRELWSSDGTTAGTTLVANIFPGGQSKPQLGSSAELNGTLYFPAQGPSGVELYKTDGTAAGTSLVRDLSPGTSSSNPDHLVAVGGALYFAANDGVHGDEPFVSDGTASGTTLLLDVFPGASSSFFGLSFLAAGPGGVYFQATSTVSNLELWFSNGTTAGTTQLADLEPSGSSWPYALTGLPTGELVFGASTSLASAELFSTDGTAAGTGLLVDLEPTTGTHSSDPQSMHSVGGEFALFSADDGVFGRELYRWDPIGGTVLIGDLDPGAASSEPGDFCTGWLSGQLVTLFRAQDSTHGQELWVTDGTAGGTQFVADIDPGSPGSGPTRLVYHPGLQCAFFMATDSANGSELWSSDGTAAGTQLVADIRSGGLGSDPVNLTVFGDRLAFLADDGAHGRELYLTDGTTLGTLQVTDLAPGVVSGVLGGMIESQGMLVFVGDDGTTGSELYASDGTAAGTQLVADIVPGIGSSGPYNLVELGDKVYFFTGGGWAANLGLYGSDLTSTGTQLVSQWSAANGIVAGELTASGTRLFFTYYGIDWFNNWWAGGLWTSDGTAVGTQGLAGDAGSFQPTGAGVFFNGLDNAFGYEPYFSDGTAAGTVLACDVNPGGGNSSPSSFTLVAGNLLFSADIPAFGRELIYISQPAAYSQDLGLGATGTTLSATAPVLGGSVIFSGEDTPAGTIAVLAVSGHIGTPNQLFVEPGNLSWIDLATFSIQGVFGTPSWSITKAIPAIPSLAGVSLNVQAWYLPATILPAKTSNGVHLVIGS
jgi:ELWxxDGT repeat protein